MSTLRVMVVGSGGREHALAWRLRQEGALLFLAPGNGGSRALGEAVAAGAEAPVEVLVAAAKQHAVDLVVVGPEAPLVAGLVDALAAEEILAFGPSQGAAQLEGSKAFSKAFMSRHGIPTADFEVFGDATEASAFLEAQAAACPNTAPWVVKADGLAAGKGVVVPDTLAEAKAAVVAMLTERRLGTAGARVVLEERLRGEEVSYHVVCDGTRYVPLAAAQDHKRAFDGDSGPNTGGMGAYSPPPVLTPAIEAQVCTRVVEPALYGMAREGVPFRGVLFVGLMIEDGVAKVLEFNVRFGDPECECLLMRLGGSLSDLLLGAARGDLSSYAPRWEAEAAMTVVLAAGGYPGATQKGVPIDGLSAAEQDPNVAVFHSGTAEGPDGRAVTAGGRVLAISARGGTVREAQERAYRAASHIRFDGMFYRRDIGHHALERH